MKIYEIEGTFLLRTGTEAEWADTSVPGRGANRVLKTGEMGWVYQTSKFKIGDGVTPWSSLDYIVPAAEHSPYALKLGDGSDANYYTYASLKEILDNLSARGEEIEQINSKVESMSNTLNTVSATVEKGKTRYYESKSQFPGIGEEGPIYIDKESGDAYFFNTDVRNGSPIGYVKLSSFDRIEASI